MKKADFILIAAVMIMAAVIFFIGSKFIWQDNSGTQVVVTRDNVFYASYPLYKNAEYTLYAKDNIDGLKDYNILVINNRNVYIKDADCENHTCIKTGNITDIGQVICCLPHRFLIHIE